MARGWPPVRFSLFTGGWWRGNLCHAPKIFRPIYLSRGGIYTATDKPVEQTRKNIQVLKGLLDSQLFLVMNFVGDSLGVHGDYRHVKGEKNPQTGEDTWLWEKDDKNEKLAGREMMRMVLALNQNQFKHDGAVTCCTCHRGNTRPERMAPLPPREFVKESQFQKKALPGAQEVINKYVPVVGANKTLRS